jgi:hypothetical protein
MMTPLVYAYRSITALTNRCAVVGRRAHWSNVRRQSATTALWWLSSHGAQGTNATAAVQDFFCYTTLTGGGLIVFSI